MGLPVFDANAIVRSVMRDRYGPTDALRVRQALQGMGTLQMQPLTSGLFAASTHWTAHAYRHAWVRDNVHIANAYRATGKPERAAAVARALLTFYGKTSARMQRIIARQVDPSDLSERPRVRIDGERLTELDNDAWAHAQNDALGYFVWLVCTLASEGVLALAADDILTMRRFVEYFDAIAYWQDADSGHWEEGRKVSASSIGVVVAGLEALATLAERQPGAPRVEPLDEDTHVLATQLIDKGRAVLSALLPAECAAPEDDKRRYDAALLFLVCPLQVVEGDMASRIIADIEQHLLGEVGIRRYQGDSYWCPDYESKLSASDRTRNFSEDMATRDRLLLRRGEEAQWCIFDPLLSYHFGRVFEQGGSPLALARQTHYFNRSLRQITPEDWDPPNSCPELYYLRDDRHVPNPHTPLLWTQANLMLAVDQLVRTSRL